MSRFFRTVRHLEPAQIVHRARLRTRCAAARALPRLAAWRARRRAGKVPAAVAGPVIPEALLRPCPRERIRAVAEEVTRGRFTFLGVTRDLPENPYPAPADVSLLWAYHLEYMDYLLDLALAGHPERVDELCRARRAAEGSRHPALVHPYPESRRIASWILVLPRVLPATRPVILERVWIWANRLRRNLEWDVGGNHLLENGLALALAGSLFTGPRAAEFRRLGRAILLSGSRTQVLSDGAHFELSPMYHARVLTVLLQGGWALDGRGESIPPGYWETLASMATFLEEILDARGELPLLGDSGRGADLDPRRLLGAAWEILPLPRRAIQRGDRYFPGSGLVRLEDASRGHRLLLDAGPVCPGNLPAHGQADTFTILLSVGGREMIVDAGLYEYRPGEMRDWCRSTRAHSTVEVDGEDSSEVYGSFRVGRRARVVTWRWFLDRGRGTFLGRHDGYRHRGALHGRLVSHVSEGLWLVADRVAGRGSPRVRSRVHLHPEVEVEQQPGGEYTFHRGEVRLELVPFGVGRTSFEDGWMCPSFGERRRSRLLVLEPVEPHVPFGYALSAGPEARLCREGDRVRVRRGAAEWLRELP